MKPLLSLLVVLFLCACPPAAPPCAVEIDGGEGGYDVQFRFVNLGRESVTLRLEGEDVGRQVPPLSSVAKAGHVSLNMQRGSVEARQFAPDGGKESVSLPFEFDATDNAPVTFVLVDTSPNRLSMNVTIGKQHGATFPERVKASLSGVEIEGGVDTEGDCAADYSGATGTQAKVGLHDEPGQGCTGTEDNDFVRPGEVEGDATPYFVHGNDGELPVAWVSKVNAGLQTAGGALGQGASLLGGALPGGAVISSAMRSFYVLNAHSNGQPATISINGIEVARDVAPGALVRVKSSLLAAVARKSVTLAGLNTFATVQTKVGASVGSTQLEVPIGPCKPPYLCDFLSAEDTLLVVSENLDSSATVLKSHHDTVKNSVGNIRRPIVLGTTSTLETQGCVSVFPTDDTCVMGAAVVSSVSSLKGGASSAAYAKTGRLLYPPKAAAVQGTSMRMGIEELGAVTERFFWDNPAGLTPVSGKAAGGFSIVASGRVLDATAATRRALFFINTAGTPWTVEASLSR